MDPRPDDCPGDGREPGLSGIETKSSWMRSGRLSRVLSRGPPPSNCCGLPVPRILRTWHASFEAIGSPDWVRVVGYMHDMPLALSVSELAVSRAGAMTTSEFLAWGIPSILIPLPTAAADHQARKRDRPK